MKKTRRHSVRRSRSVRRKRTYRKRNNRSTRKKRSHRKRKNQLGGSNLGEPRAIIVPSTQDYLANNNSLAFTVLEKKSVD